MPRCIDRGLQDSPFFLRVAALARGLLAEVALKEKTRMLASVSVLAAPILGSPLRLAI
jgi:hypothetical protein